METVQNSDYDCHGDSVMYSSDALEMTASDVNRERLDHTNEARLTVDNGSVLEARNKLFKKRIGVAVIATLIALFVIAVPIMVYVFVTLEKEDIDDCIQGVCGSHGTCVDGLDSYSCSCKSGFRGMHCETNIDDCIQGVCGSHGTCVDGLDSYSCSCKSGFRGMHCETNIDDCIQGVCGSHGTCVDGLDSYSCSCKSGFRGMHCETNIDDCIPDVCGSHGTCVDGVDSYSCSCITGYSGVPCETNHTDCYDVISKQNNSESGVYSVTLWQSRQTINVFCDMKTDNGGWTVFQYRFNGSVDFYRNFKEYENGFGNFETEFWLGLKSVQEMAYQGKTELRLDLTAADGTTAYETFQNFYLDEDPYYTLHIDRGQGTAGDTRGLSYNNGYHFTTYDADRDGSWANCAADRSGGWWYNTCAWANLNGEYVTPGTKRPLNAEGGMIYYDFQEYRSLKAVKMMFRRV
ncbi:microfibril-associated glycoprotein 4-like isoform X1 [Mercenaria mercenaria]|uniref:microfibril-associated glycoprotein 4-like isoform X1 n=1 Tax=Mercenaria mercenaria TaxID=6596 RepID=UPI00234EEC5F|nr:microfibril-associated glycoprotein 4-like isoform X1 [Mercenaria mercenaria]